MHSLNANKNVIRLIVYICPRVNGSVGMPIMDYMIKLALSWSLQQPHLGQYSTRSLSRTVIVPSGTYNLYPYPLLEICKQDTR